MRIEQFHKKRDRQDKRQPVSISGAVVERLRAFCRDNRIKQIEFIEVAITEALDDAERQLNAREV